jgi:hypothetical protein
MPDRSESYRVVGIATDKLTSKRIRVDLSYFKNMKKEEWKNYEEMWMNVNDANINKAGKPIYLEHSYKVGEIKYSFVDQFKRLVIVAEITDQNVINRLKTEKLYFSVSYELVNDQYLNVKMADFHEVSITDKPLFGEGCSIVIQGSEGKIKNYKLIQQNII